MAFKLDFSKLNSPKTEEERLADEQRWLADQRARDTAKREENSRKSISLTVEEAHSRATTSGDRVISLYGTDDKGRRAKAEFWVPECYERGTAYRIENEIGIGSTYKMHGYWKPFTRPGKETQFTFQAQKMDGISLETLPIERPDRSGSYASVASEDFSDFIDREARATLTLGGPDAIAVALGNYPDSLGTLAPKISVQVEAAIRHEDGRMMITEDQERLARVATLTREAFLERPAHNGPGPLTAEYGLIWDKNSKLEYALGAAYIATIGAHEIARAGFEVPDEDLDLSRAASTSKPGAEPIKVFFGAPDVWDAVESLEGHHEPRSDLAKALVAFSAAANQPHWERKDGQRPRLTGETVVGAAALVNTVAVFPSNGRLKIEFDADKVSAMKPSLDPAVVAIFDRAAADTSRLIGIEAVRPDHRALVR